MSRAVFAAPRRPDWELALDAAISAALSRPFAWGSHDCCTFAAGVVKAMTGVDPMKGLHGYRSEAGARRVLAREGWRSPFYALHGVLGSSIAPAQARRGDVVYARLEGAVFSGGIGAGICLGDTSAFPGTTGLQFLPTLSCRKAWRI